MADGMAFHVAINIVRGINKQKTMDIDFKILNLQYNLFLLQIVIFIKFLKH